MKFFTLLFVFIVGINMIYPTPITTERPPVWNRITTADHIRGCNQPTKVVVISSPYKGDAVDHANYMDQCYERSWHYTVDDIGAVKHLNCSSGSRYWGSVVDCQQITILTTPTATEETLQYAIADARKYTGVQLIYDDRRP